MSAPETPQLRAVTLIHERIVERTEEFVPELSIPNGQPDLYGRCLSMWSIQDTLLQSYRNFMLTSQSILLAIAIYAAQTHFPWLVLLPATPGLLLNWDWGKMVQSRGLDVYYFQWQMLRIEAGIVIATDILTEFKHWQKRSIRERRAMLQEDTFGKHLIGGRGARRLDKQIPLTLRCCWTIVVLFAVKSLIPQLVHFFAFITHTLR